jgi:hypothetical protein
MQRKCPMSDGPDLGQLFTRKSTSKRRFVFNKAVSTFSVRSDHILSMKTDSKVDNRITINGSFASCTIYGEIRSNICEKCFPDVSTHAKKYSKRFHHFLSMLAHVDCWTKLGKKSNISKFLAIFIISKIWMLGTFCHSNMFLIRKKACLKSFIAFAPFLTQNQYSHPSVQI